MTTFRPPRAKSYRYDFRYKGRRYTGSTDQITKADADLVEAQIKKSLRQDAWGITPFDRTATPAFSKWAQVYLKAQQKRVTRPDIIQRTLRMVLAFFGRKPVKHAVAGGPYHDLRLADPILEPEWLLKFEAWMDKRKTKAGAPIAGATKNTYRSALSGLYRLAMKPGWRRKTRITVNPCAGMDRDPQRSRRTTVTPEQLRAWISAAPPHVRLALAIGALAPELRLASILALRWETHLAQDLSFITVTEHKTIRSTGAPQVMPIDPQLARILTPLQQKRGALITFRGEPVASIKRALKTAATDAGLDYGQQGVTFHSLRHTMATMLAELGVSEEQRRLVMGHSDIRTTQQYTHLRPLFKRGPLAQLSAAISIEDAVASQAEDSTGKSTGTPKRTRENR